MIRNGWLVLACVVACLLVAAAWSGAQQPRYRSQAVLGVASDGTPTDLTAAAVALSDPGLWAAVGAELGVEGVADDIDVRVDGDAVTVRALADHPGDAFRLVDGLLTEYRGANADTRLEVRTAPSIPADPAEPRAARVMTLAVLAGLAIGAVSVHLVERLRRRTAADGFDLSDHDRQTAAWIEALAAPPDQLDAFAGAATSPRRATTTGLLPDGPTLGPSWIDEPVVAPSAMDRQAGPLLVADPPPAPASTPRRFALTPDRAPDDQ